MDLDARYCLFDLICTTGDWKRCRTQLEALVELGGDPSGAVGILANLNAAEERGRCWAGEIPPRLIGELDPADQGLMETLADALRGTSTWNQVRELAGSPTFGPGTLDGEAFEDLLTADDRLPGLLEVAVRGAYRWLWLGSVRRIEMAARPGVLRDLRWIPARVFLLDGSVSEMSVFGFYPGTEISGDAEAKLGKRLSWQDLPDEIAFGHGPQVLWVDGENRPLHQVKVIDFTAGEGAADGSNPTAAP